MLKLYSESHFDECAGKTINYTSPYWYLKWRPLKSQLDFWLDQAIELCKTDITHELFGLSLVDLLNMDVRTFLRVSREIMEIRKEREKQREQIEKDSAIPNH